MSSNLNIDALLNGRCPICGQSQRSGYIECGACHNVMVWVTIEEGWTGPCVPGQESLAAEILRSEFRRSITAHARLKTSVVTLVVYVLVACVTIAMIAMLG
jgi:hypothetical protein